ncbi:hypothetical protein B4U80_09306 [Leptotrombidium deliense]|uniref:Uncharacterized protein n=1 Tax=Leptotrombidium deliense TaxID=299467 RepID=A0A443QMW7_9ACAR|nr:hypothetical protein B4U80_09306 [Leptotrombidium deliense]
MSRRSGSGNNYF